MNKCDYSGYWTGEFEGTNRGGIAFNLQQHGETISGTARVYEPLLGQYEFSVSGHAKDKILLNLTPLASSQVEGVGNAKISGQYISKGVLSGNWSTDIGTEGVFTATLSQKKELPKDNSVFIVHGHDDGAVSKVARFLEKCKIDYTILSEQLSQGMTVIEKFEEYALKAGFAIILMTPDDIGYPKDEEDQKRFRPRQNVIFELGYFSATLGRNKTIVFTKGDVEFPSDLLGLVYVPLDSGEGWKIALVRELLAAGFDIDLKAVFT